MSDSSELPGSYSFALRALHWLIAGVILTAIVLGVAALGLERGTPVRMLILTVHKSLGVTALVLVVLRIVVRLIEKAPAYVPPLTALNHAGAGIVHLGLYALMLAMPISGYIDSGAGKHDFSWFGLFMVPNFVPEDKALSHLASQTHYWLALLIGAALIAHIAGAVWHAAVKRDLVFTRMWPSWRPKRA